MLKKDYSNWTKEELIRELEKFKKYKKYGIVWEDKPEQVALMCKEKLPVLTEVKDKEIKTDENKPTNILIEGDNYHALSVLNYTHKGKIDVIYIDPPYNTGNEGFMYNDKIVDKEDAYRHSKWLSFMEKRLRLAKNLLSDKGVIFISIDDNEIAQLKLLCDEIFEEQNLITNIIWKSRSSLQYSEPLISSQTEYILAYTKNKKKWNNIEGLRFNRVKRDTDKLSYSNPDNDPRGPWTSSGLIRDDGRKKYLIVTPSGKKYYEAWLYTEKNMGKFRREGLLWFGKDGDSKPRKKSFWKDFEGKVSSNLLMDEFVYFEDEEGNLKKKKLFEIGTTEKGTKELKEIFNISRTPFDYPKPTTLIKYLINLYPNKNAVVLDFFAGTGTTGHAVLELNKEDGGNRKFILCTNNENNICTDVCYPRIEKVIKGYKKLKGEKVEGLKGNLKYFKTDFVDAESTDKNKRKLVDKSTEMLCLKEDCFDFVLEGNHFKIFKNNEGKYLGIIYDDDGIEPFKKEAKKLKKKFVVYVFSLDDSAREEEFEDMNNVELKPIPAVILNVYKRIFRGI